jgi:hypothetical protein
MLSISLEFGDGNAVSRLSQLLLSFIIASFPLLHGRMIKIIGRRRFAILFSDLALVSFIPFSTMRVEAVSTIIAFIFLASFPILINHRFSTYFIIDIFHISIYRPFFIVISMEKETKVEGNFYTFGIGISKETAGRIAARRASSMVKHGKIILPISKEKGSSTEYIKNLEILQTLSFAIRKDITFIESSRTDYQGFVDAIAERYGSSYAISIFGSEPYIMSEDEFILLKHIYNFSSV